MNNKPRLDSIECILGNKCVDMRLGYAGVLIVGFNNLVEYENPRLKGKYHGEWELRSDQSTWRVIEGNKILCGEYDDIGLIDTVFSDFHGLTLLAYENGSFATDLNLLFSGGRRLEIASISSEMTSWELSGPSRHYVSSTNGEFGDSECDAGMVIGLSEEEQELLSRSEQCHRRWQSRVPAEGSGRCNLCHYYLPLEANFFFHDYGVCTNADSTSDGQLVGAHSHCKHFRIGGVDEST